MRYLFERHLLGKAEDEGGALLRREPLHSRPDGLKLLADCELAFRRSPRVGSSSAVGTAAIAPSGFAAANRRRQKAVRRFRLWSAARLTAIRTSQVPTLASPRKLLRCR